MVHDFHLHTFFSDGQLSPVELARRAQVNGYVTLAFTDHASPSNIEFLIENLRKDQEVIEREWGLTALVGVELTHVPAHALGRVAEQAKMAGAEIVVVHGETPVEPVEPGTNRAAVESPFVDILAHPGLLSEQEARLAAENDVYLEISSRRGHCLGNGRVVNLARATGAKLLINSDSHAPGDIHTAEFVRKVGLGAGLTPEEVEKVATVNAVELIHHLRGGEGPRD